MSDSITDKVEVSADGTQFWYLNGRLHRVDGPAILYQNGTQLWYLDDKQVTEAEHKRLTQKPVVDDCVGKVVEIDGKKYKLALV